MTAISRSAASALDARLSTELWRQIEERLAEGESLATSRQFQSAIESAYLDFTGQAPPADVSARLRQLVQDVNQERPDTYLAQGMQNAVQKAFARGEERLHWDLVRVQRHGSASIGRFLRRERIRGFLSEIRMDPKLIDVYECVRHGVAATGTSTQAAQPTNPRTTTLLAPMPPAEPRSPFVTVPETSATEVTEPEPDQVRIREQERVRVQLQARQMEQLPKTLAVYVEDGLVSAEAEAQHRQLAEIDRDLRNHDIDADEAEAQRVEILDEAGRLALESDLRSVVAGVVSICRSSMPCRKFAVSMMGCCAC